MSECVRCCGETFYILDILTFSGHETSPLCQNCGDELVSECKAGKITWPFWWLIPKGHEWFENMKNNVGRE